MGASRSATSRTCLTRAALVVAARVPGWAQGDNLVPVTGATLQEPHPADRPMWRRTLDVWGYRPPGSIPPENVGVPGAGRLARLVRGTPVCAVDAVPVRSRRLSGTARRSMIDGGLANSDAPGGLGR